jgi:4-hydroxy-tetrahydrodipicolinate synthase
MTSQTLSITGSIVAMITPMLPTAVLTIRVCESWLTGTSIEGTDCIGVVGTTGESPTVSMLRRTAKSFASRSNRHAGRVPIMAGCGSNCTAEAIELARFAKQVGADCQLQVVPYYNKPTQEGQSSTSRQLPKRWTCR